MLNCYKSCPFEHNLIKHELKHFLAKNKFWNVYCKLRAILFKSDHFKLGYRFSWTYTETNSFLFWHYNDIVVQYLLKFTVQATICYTDCLGHDDVIKWKQFPRHWPFVREIHRSPVKSPHQDQWHRALMFSLICVWINGWVNNREAGDLRRYPAHYDVTVMVYNGSNIRFPH